MVQVGVLRIPAVRKYFKIVPQASQATTEIKAKKNFKEGFQDCEYFKV